MSDTPTAPTVADLWTRYDEIRASGNLHAAAKYALDVRLFETSRPTTAPASTEATAEPSPEIAAFRAARAINPIAAANALVRGTFRK